MAMIWSLVAFLGLVAAVASFMAFSAMISKSAGSTPRERRFWGCPGSGRGLQDTQPRHSKGDMPSTLMSMARAITANRSRLPMRLNSWT